MPRLDGLLEAALYVEDPGRSARFYERVLGLEVIARGDRLWALGVSGRQVLLLCRQGASTRLPIGAHDGRGQLHVAFAVSTAELEAWEHHLERLDVPIEERRTWDRGGQSLYFRDPDGHLLELATPGVWTVY
jgi:catechol 2,3-dioxygenase-like lactoylglutathione lyase family enzyme